jgi:hypothetical protein
MVAKDSTCGEVGGENGEISLDCEWWRIRSEGSAESTGRALGSSGFVQPLIGSSVIVLMLQRRPSSIWFR